MGNAKVRGTYRQRKDNPIGLCSNHEPTVKGRAVFVQRKDTEVAAAIKAGETAGWPMVEPQNGPFVGRLYRRTPIGNLIRV